MSVIVEYFVRQGKIFRAVYQPELPEGAVPGLSYCQKLSDLADWSRGDIREDLTGVNIPTSSSGVVERSKPGDWIIERSVDEHKRRYFPVRPKVMTREFMPVTFEVHPYDWPNLQN